MQSPSQPPSQPPSHVAVAITLNAQASSLKSNPKSFYRYVRSKTKSKVRVGHLKDSAGNVIDDNKSMCEILNNYFASVFTQENISNIPRSNRFLMVITVKN